MRRSQVVDVNVVANARAVWRGIVVAENANALTFTNRHLQHDRDQVRLGIVVFPDVARQRSPGRVEISQCCVPDPVSPGIILQSPFDDQLREPVGIDRLLGFVFSDGHRGRLAVGGRSTGKDDLRNVDRPHRLEQRTGGHYVVLVIAMGELNRLTNLGKCGKVHDCLDRVLLHGSLQQDRIG